MISPAEVIGVIADRVPRLLDPVAVEPLPNLEAANELARIVAADPSRFLDAAAALDSHRSTIDSATRAAAELIARAGADITGLGQRYLAESGALLPLALAPGAAVPVAARLAALAAEALGQIGARLDALEAQLHPHAERLRAVAAAIAAEGPLQATPAANQATDDLRALAAPESAPVAMEAAAEPNQVLAPVADGEGGSAAGRAAVAAAKSQLGAPYRWGGTGPDGFDCSGLTSWAYRQAGIELPRMAHQQAIGTQVSYADLQPGDLAVWDGHVAMYAGDGMYIEAGDPVQMNPVRTNNLGMGFKGFWRPTG